MDTNRKNIKSLSLDDRPREKMIAKGKESLSNAELLAILLGSGTTTMNAVELARHIFSSQQNEVNQLAKRSLKELMQFPGIGPAKAVTIAAALELGRRRIAEQSSTIKLIKDSQSAYHILSPHLADATEEYFYVLYLNQRNQVLSTKKVSHGGITGTVVDKRIILKEAILMQATAIILAHNHPSGNLSPSPQDIKITKELCEASKLVDIRVLDHLIITQTSYTSLKDSGYF